MTSIAERLTEVRMKIIEQCQQHKRLTDSVQLIAVSKSKPISDIVEAFNHGQRQFGENYVQEAVAKVQQLQELPIEWHFLGPIQSNKTRDIANHFHWVHSVDRLKIAQRLSAQRSDSQAALNLLIQVNIDDDAAKAGIAPAQLLDFAAQIAALPRVQLRGLMTIPAVTTDPSQTATSFAAMNRLFLQLKSQYPQVDTLSMGMSADWPIAIAQGATMIRIGTALFGAREHSPQSTGDSQ